jgi:hypothetical protein
MSSSPLNTKNFEWAFISTGAILLVIFQVYSRVPCQPLAKGILSTWFAVMLKSHLSRPTQGSDTEIQSGLVVSPYGAQPLQSSMALQPRGKH